MKSIYLIRHAKSSWGDLSLDDHDRPLNERGKRDAPIMATLLKGKGIVPDLFLSSTAKRAKRTAKIFFKTLGGTSQAGIQLDKDLYHAYPNEISRIIRELPDSIMSVAIFAHNPGLTLLANEFRGDLIDNVPTCAIVAGKIDISEWKNFEAGKTELTAFYYPKMFV